MNKHDENLRSFSIRSLLFVTFVIGAFLAGLLNPSDAMVFFILATLVASVAVAWSVVLRDWPNGSGWLLSFAIAITILALDLYLVPSAWRNITFAFVHPVDAAEYARSAASGFNKKEVAFDSIFVDGMMLLLATGSASLVSVLQPQRVSVYLICGWIVIASASLFFVHDGIAFAVSVVNIIVLTLAWFVILRDLQSTPVVQIAFTLSVTCFMLFTHARMLPEPDLYSVLHTPPASLSDIHQERYVFQAMYRDCVALWFGGIVALSVGLVARKKTNALNAT